MSDIDAKASENIMRKIIVRSGFGLALTSGLYYAHKYRQSIVTKPFLMDIPPSEKLKMKFEPKRWDLTMKIDPKTIVYPGDPTFKIDTIAEVGAEGSTFKLCQLSMGNHTGTHIDYPRHVITDGKTSESYTIDDHIKNGLVIEVPRNFGAINREFVSRYHDLNNKIVFFKTRNSELSKHEPYTENFVYIEPEAAQYLVEQGVVIVGIDYISVDSESAHDLPTHNELLKKGVLIVENLEMTNVPAGEYKIYVLPLNVRDADGVPARVFAEELRS